jgi:hypothetical protein
VLWDLQNEIRVKRGKTPFDYPAGGAGAGVGTKTAEKEAAL